MPAWDSSTDHFWELNLSQRAYVLNSYNKHSDFNNGTTDLIQVHDTTLHSSCFFKISQKKHPFNFCASGGGSSRATGVLQKQRKEGTQN